MVSSSSSTSAAPRQNFIPAPKPAETPHISWEQFEKKYLSREDRWKYEWVRGVVQKTPRTMNQTQALLWANLKNLLESLRTSDKALGELMQEVDSFFDGAHRRPDISYFSKPQMLAIPNGNQIPQFVIEIISKSDQIILVNEKMEDYRSVNIPVIWHIFPNLRMVHEYRGKTMTILTGDDVCSAEPVIPGFKIKASAIFEV